MWNNFKGNMVAMLFIHVLGVVMTFVYLGILRGLLARKGD